VDVSAVVLPAVVLPAVGVSAVVLPAVVVSVDGGPLVQWTVVR
jgi:hypothetical protein